MTTVCGWFYCARKRFRQQLNRSFPTLLICIAGLWSFSLVFRAPEEALVRDPVVATHGTSFFLDHLGSVREASASSSFSNTTSISQKDRRHLVLVFGSERTGSNLLNGLLSNLDLAFDDDIFDIMGLAEVFSPGMHLKTLTTLAFKMVDVCSTQPMYYNHPYISKTNETWRAYLKMYENNLTATEQFLIDTTTMGVKASIDSRCWSWPQQLVNVTKDRYNNAIPFLSFLKTTPTIRKRSTATSAQQQAHHTSFVTFKVFRKHFRKLFGFNVSSFLNQLIEPVWNDFEIKIIVLWRRRFIESFVSQEIAAQRKLWRRRRLRQEHRKTDESHAITIDNQARLEFFARDWFRYHHELYATLDQYQERRSSSGEYESRNGRVSHLILEYSRDLLDADKQRKTVRRLMNFLDIPLSAQEGINLDDILYGDKSKWLVKQAQVPIRQQVLNWEEVKEWGFIMNEIDESEWDKYDDAGWEDLFTNATNPKLKWIT